LILGIDPGTMVTGYGVVQYAPPHDFSLRECGVFRTSSKQLLGVRVREIYDEVKTVIERFEPDVVVVGRVYSPGDKKSCYWEWKCYKRSSGIYGKKKIES
jgi:crossover junction endodeoxyribonuclease RuvC